MNTAEYNRRLLMVVAEIRTAEFEYRESIEAWAEAERRYKRAAAYAVPAVGPCRTIGERDAKVEVYPLADGGTVNDLRYDAHLKEGLVNASKLAVQNRHAELSALQSEAALARSEAELLRFADTGP